MTDFIGQKCVDGQIMPAKWLVMGRYRFTWMALGHRVLRPARPEDGSLPIKANGQQEWAVPLNRAIKSLGEAVATEAPPAEATIEVIDVGAEVASADPVKRKRGRPRKHAVS